MRLAHAAAVKSLSGVAGLAEGAFLERIRNYTKPRRLGFLLSIGTGRPAQAIASNPPAGKVRNCLGSPKAYRTCPIRWWSAAWHRSWIAIWA